MPLSNRLKEHRARLGVNEQELGALAGVSRQTISLIGRGDYSPSVTLALKIAKICNVTVEDIYLHRGGRTMKHMNKTATTHRRIRTVGIIALWALAGSATGLAILAVQDSAFCSEADRRCEYPPYGGCSPITSLP